MKRSNRKTAAWVFAALSALGVAHAEEGPVEVLSPTQIQLRIIQTLLDQGIFKLTERENWYEINHQRLLEMMDLENYGDEAAHRTMEILRRICGPETEITEVNIIVARMGTQDFAAIR